VPGCAVVLRIRADDPRAKVEFGSKYGADMQAVPRLLEVAKVLGLSVAGVSFHVGSGSTSPDAYDDAISAAKHVFNQVGPLARVHSRGQSLSHPRAVFALAHPKDSKPYTGFLLCDFSRP